MIECRKDIIIIHRATGVGYGVISEIQRSQKPLKTPKIGYFFIFWALEPDHPYIESHGPILFNVPMVN